MSEADRLEERLRALGAAPNDGADWQDVRRRAEERLPVGVPRRRLVLAFVAALAVAAAVAGVLVAFGTRLAPGASKGPTGAAGPWIWAGAKGPTGLHGPTGRIGPTGYAGPTGHDGPTGGANPLALALSDLKDASQQLGESIYWAGPHPTDVYPREDYLSFFRHGGNWVVAYRPVRSDDVVKRRYLLTVATYPFPGAFAALKEQAGDKGVAGPDGSVIYVNPHDPKSVLMAFPNADYEVEIRDPSAAVALATAKSGDVRPVAGG